MGKTLDIQTNLEEKYIDVTKHMEEKAILKIYNRLGNTLKLIEVEDKLNRIDISDIPEGTYFMCMMHGTKSKVIRFTMN